MTSRLRYPYWRMRSAIDALQTLLQPSSKLSLLRVVASFPVEIELSALIKRSRDVSSIDVVLSIYEITHTCRPKPPTSKADLTSDNSSQFTPDSKPDFKNRFITSIRNNAPIISAPAIGLLLLLQTAAVQDTSCQATCHASAVSGTGCVSNTDTACLKRCGQDYCHGLRWSPWVLFLSLVYGSGEFWVFRIVWVWDTEEFCLGQWTLPPPPASLFPTTIIYSYNFDYSRPRPTEASTTLQ
ncbi:hypothetical protein C8R46DRAFT_1213797 [Mycena filopes]|nr:hypothetical protein C8R46DRAFT_1213797 [Mycena filopes]